MPRVHVPEGSDIIHKRMFAHHQPAYLKPWVDLKTAVDDYTILPFEVQEMARYRIAHINGCLICQAARMPDKKGEKLPEAMYHDILSWRTSALYSPAVRAAIEYAEKFALDHESIDDAYFDGLRAHYSESEIVDLTYTIAKFMGFGRMTHVLGLDDSCAVNAPALVD